MFDYLVVYELHVADKTFYLHGIIKGENAQHAERLFFEQAPVTTGEGFTVQKKGFLGPVTENLVYLENLGGGLNLANTYKTPSEIEGHNAAEYTGTTETPTEAPTTND